MIHNKKYKEYPSALKEYKHVFGRHALATRLPLSSTQHKKRSAYLIIPLILLYVTTSYICMIYTPVLFLGWPIHLLCFIVLALIMHDLCPPKWTEVVEVHSGGVSVETSGMTSHEHWRLPLSQYRGVIPVVHHGINNKREPFSEYGVALKHPDPSKTILLMLNPLPNRDAVQHYAQLLGVPALPEKRYALRLKSKA
jgi:hypothetical protein